MQETLTLFLGPSPASQLHTAPIVDVTIILIIISSCEYRNTYCRRKCACAEISWSASSLVHWTIGTTSVAIGLVARPNPLTREESDVTSLNPWAYGRVEGL